MSGPFGQRTLYLVGKVPSYQIRGSLRLQRGSRLTLTFISPKLEFKGTLQLLPMKPFSIVSKSGLAHISAEARTCWGCICINQGLKGHFSFLSISSVYGLLLRLFSKDLCTVTDSNMGAGKPPLPFRDFYSQGVKVTMVY